MSLCAGWGFKNVTEIAGLGLDANLLRFVKQHVMGHVGFRRILIVSDD